MSVENSVVSVFNTHLEAEAAIKELQKSGFDLKKLSVVGKDYQTEENLVGYYNTGDRWAHSGADYGDCYSGQRSFSFLGLVPWLSVVHWWCGSLEPLRVLH